MRRFILVFQHSAALRRAGLGPLALLLFLVVPLWALGAVGAASALRAEGEAATTLLTPTPTPSLTIEMVSIPSSVAAGGSATITWRVGGVLSVGHTNIHYGYHSCPDTGADLICYDVGLTPAQQGGPGLFTATITNITQTIYLRAHASGGLSNAAATREYVIRVGTPGPSTPVVTVTPGTPTPGGLAVDIQDSEASQGPICPTYRVSFSMQVSNRGSTTLSNVPVDVELMSLVQPLLNDPVTSRGAVHNPDTNVVSWLLSSLAPGQTTTLYLVVRTFSNFPPGTSFTTGVTVGNSAMGFATDVESTFVLNCATATPQPSLTPTLTPSPTPSPTNTLTAMPTETALPTETVLPTETALSTETAEPSATAEPTETVTPTSTSTLEVTATVSPTPEPDAWHLFLPVLKRVSS